MEAKLDSLLQLLQNSEARMSQEMQSIKLAVDAIKPEIATIKRSLHSLKPEKEEDEILNRLATSATSGASPVCSDTSLVVANNTNGPAAPTPTRCSTESPSRTATESAPAFAPATTLTSSTAIVDVVPKLAPTTASSMALEAVPPTAPTSLEVTTTKLLKPFTVIDLSALTPSKCSNECLVVDSTKLGDVVSHEMGEVVALIVANIISVDPGDRRQPPWPPPQICNIRLSCLGISDRSPIQLKPWPGEPQYQCSMGMHHSPPLHALDGYLPLRQIFLLWHPVRKALQSGENLSILRSPNSVWKLLQCDSGIKTSAHLCIQECPAEYHLASVTVGTVNGYHSLVQFRFQSYIASNGLLNCSSNVQSNIAWFYNCHVTVMKLQKLSWECMVSIGVHLTRGSVCHAILCVEGNKFRNLTCRESSAIFKHQGGCYVEDTTLSMCQESTMGIGIHSKVFIPCLMRGTDRIFCVLNVRSEAYQLLVQFRHSFALPLVHCINTFCWWSPYLRLGAAILWDFIDITAQLSRTYRISLVEVFTVAAQREYLRVLINEDIYQLHLQLRRVQLSCWRRRCTGVNHPWPPLWENSSLYELQEHVYLGVEVLDMQLLGSCDISVSGGCNTSVCECVFIELQQLTQYQYLLSQPVATHLNVNLMELFARDAASRWYGYTELHCIIIGMPNYHRCSARRYQSEEPPEFQKPEQILARRTRALGSSFIKEAQDMF